MDPLDGKTAIVTGASRGIGKAIAAALHRQAARVIMLGRSGDRLQEAAAEFAGTGGPTPEFVEADLSDREQLRGLAGELVGRHEELDILVNCAGAYARGGWEEATPESLELLLATNVEGPYILTRALLPSLVRARGDVVFVNSSVTRSAGMNTSQFAATQHALKALADSLRAEYNDRGIRITSIFPGRTATPRQEEIFAAEGREYRADRLLQPEEVADSVLFCLAAGATAEVTDLHIRPRFKA